MPVTAREAALNALLAYEKRGARPDMVLYNLAIKEKMDSRDIALSSHITNGVLQNMALCDYYLNAVSGRDVTKFEIAVLYILRIAVYQMLFLDRVPDHAAVSEGVELSKKYAKRASGLVNAILRKFSGNKDNLPIINEGDEVKNLSLKYSHPLWLTQKLSDEYGIDTCEKILKTDNLPAPTTIEVNTLKTTSEKVKESLHQKGAQLSEQGFLDNAFLVSGVGAIDALTEYRDGSIYAQDTAAKLAVMAADPRPGMTVIDACAAPGGKSFAAAIAMENKGTIYSFDIHEKKLSLIESGAKRLGIDIIKTAQADGRELIPDLIAIADLVIADVPCSGMGVIRKKPEIRYKNENDLMRLPEIQLSILRNVCNYVKPGGTLLYSTCTILKSENEGVIEAFLKENDNFELSEITLPEPFNNANGHITILPHIADTDGFFICRMKRVK